LVIWEHFKLEAKFPLEKYGAVAWHFSLYANRKQSWPWGGVKVCKHQSS
jgi:hypothetical protein